MDIKEQLKSKSLSELFMLIRNGSGAMALSASEEIERRLSAQQMRAVDGAYWLCKKCGQRNDDAEHFECVACGSPRN